MNKVSLEDVNGERHIIDLEGCVIEHLTETFLGLTDRGYYIELEVYRVVYTGGKIAIISLEVYKDLRNRLTEGRTDMIGYNKEIKIG